MSAGRERRPWSLPHRSRTPAGARTGSTDRAARLRDLHEASYADLLRFVQRRLPGVEAEDVVASVFETAWVRLDDVPPDVEDARPWLFGVARNAMANHHRAAVRRSSLAVRVATTAAPDADVLRGEHDGVSARVDLVRAWRTLDDADQEVLSLVAFDGLSGAQAAQVLGTSRSAFAMRLQRARQRLAAALHAGTGAPPGAAPRAVASRRRDTPAPTTPPSPSQEMTWSRP